MKTIKIHPIYNNLAIELFMLSYMKNGNKYKTFKIFKKFNLILTPELNMPITQLLNLIQKKTLVMLKIKNVSKYSGILQAKKQPQKITNFEAMKLFLNNKNQHKDVKSLEDILINDFKQGLLNTGLFIKYKINFIKELLQYRIVV